SDGVDRCAGIRFIGLKLADGVERFHDEPWRVDELPVTGVTARGLGLLSDLLAVGVEISTFRKGSLRRGGIRSAGIRAQDVLDDESAAQNWRSAIVLRVGVQEADAGEEARALGSV